MKTIVNFINEKLTLNNQSKLKTITSEKDYYNEINKILDSSLGTGEKVTSKNPTFKISSWPSNAKISFYDAVTQGVPHKFLETTWMKYDIYEFDVMKILKHYNSDYKKAIEEISNMIDRYMSVDPYEN